MRSRVRIHTEPTVSTLRVAHMFLVHAKLQKLPLANFCPNNKIDTFVFPFCYIFIAIFYTICSADNKNNYKSDNFKSCI